jgi:GntR family transcriptional regulator/MocR family aminotransferase
MLTYKLEKKNGLPLYESLYRQIKDDILGGRLKAGEKLPSKRQLAEHLHISRVTVENAYSQLMAEGYLYSVEKSGYFVDKVI